MFKYLAVLEITQHNITQDTKLRVSCSVSVV